MSQCELEIVKQTVKPYIFILMISVLIIFLNCDFFDIQLLVQNRLELRQNIFFLVYL